MDDRMADNNPDLEPTEMSKEKAGRALESVIRGIGAKEAEERATDAAMFRAEVLSGLNRIGNSVERIGESMDNLVAILERGFAMLEKHIGGGGKKEGPDATVTTPEDEDTG